MIVDTASLSLIGDREENQDRLCVLRRQDTVLAVVIDGMGGHESGGEAAQLAVDDMQNTFTQATLPITDEKAFMRTLLHQAHDAIVGLGDDRALGAKPRATCVAALIHNDRVLSAHVGDSRVYLLRDGEVVARTRDHSHIEILLQEGLITEDEYREHPLRNYVEYCLGGEPGEPTMTISDARQLKGGDIILLCSDGLWSGVDDPDIALAMYGPGADRDLQQALAALLQVAVRNCAPAADNTTAAAVRWVATPPPGTDANANDTKT